MAITRAQQVKQMLQDGGRIGFFTGMREAEQREKAANQQRAQTFDVSKTNTPTRSRIQNEQNENFRKNQLKELLDQQQEEKDFEPFETLMVKNTKVPTFIPGSTIMNLGLGATQKVRQDLLNKNVDFFRFDPKTRKAREKYGLDAAGYEEYMRARLAGEIDAAGNPLITGDQDPTKGNNFIPVDTTFNTDQEEDTDTEDDEFFRRFRADGGIMGGLADGQMDEMGRQMYGLGKLVKKATRAVKKIAKSPIGKIALLYTGAGALSNLAAGSGLGGMFTGFTNPRSFLAKEGLRNIFTKTGAKNILFGQAAGTAAGPFDYLQKGVPKATSGLLGFGGELSPLKAITAVSAVAGALTPEQEAEAQRISDETGIDIEKVRNSILAAGREQYAMDFRARGFKADGGLMRLGYQEGSKEPVAKKTMPLLDMGGKEKDYRETGGFVDMGRMEKADDVPARLSKNEFVFTADAVRNAGDGDVDKGAEVMYNMMKNLESGGDVSEESQGLKGARRMFQTSQRLEEVL